MPETLSVADMHMDLGGLRWFVEQLQDTMRELIDDARWISARRIDVVREAWRYTREEFDETLAWLRDLEAGTDPLHAAPGAIDDPRLTDLHSHGLLGARLHMKLKAWRDSFYAFGKRHGRQWAAKALSIGGSIIDSFKSATALGKGIAEFVAGLGTLIAK